MLLPRLARLSRLLRSERFPRDRGLLVLLVRTVGLGLSAAVGELGRAAFLTRRRRAGKTALISPGSFPAPTAATMPAAAASASAATALAAISTIGTIARNLTLLAVRLDVGSRLAACRGPGSIHRRLRWAWADIPISRRAPILIPVLPIAVTAVTVAPTITITSAITSAPLGTLSITVAAALTALAAAGLAGMLPTTIAMSLATVGRAMS